VKNASHRRTLFSQVDLPFGLCLWCEGLMRSLSCTLTLSVCFVALAGCGGCGGASPGTSSDSGVAVLPDGGAATLPDGGTVTACVNLGCQQTTCAGGGTTSVTGTVFAPNGVQSLYNAVVYVPNAPVQPLAVGASCERCGGKLSGDPLVSTLSDFKGQFELKNVPVGKDIPLVIQLGKWRRQIVIPEVRSCQENKLTDANLTRLPRNQTEGNMPRIAVTRGGCDNLGCMLPKLGIDPKEIGVSSDGDAKAVHIYDGDVRAGGFGGAGPLAGAASAKTLWNDLNQLKRYDVAVLSCECSESPGTKDAVSYKTVTDYLALGGRIFTTDFQYAWYRYTPDADLKSISNITGGAPEAGRVLYLDDSFPKGKSLADWLKHNFSTSTYGQVETSIVFNNFRNPVDPAKTQIWARADSGGKSGNARVFTVNTPVGAPEEMKCGKAVHIDAHVNQRTKDVFPSSCSEPLLQAEAMFAFFFLDLTGCIQKDDQPPSDGIN
jgi:hypothetical protein